MTTLGGEAAIEHAFRMLTYPDLLRAARHLLGLSQEQLATRAGVTKSTVVRVEAGVAVRSNSIAAIQRALEEAGVMFISEGDGLGPGLRVKDPRALRTWNSQGR